MEEKKKEILEKQKKARNGKNYCLATARTSPRSIAAHRGAQPTSLSSSSAVVEAQPSVLRPLGHPLALAITLALAISPHILAQPAHFAAIELAAVELSPRVSAKPLMIVRGFLTCNSC
ncbi:uncharacterized protein A4U43_C03F1970 [Asparagus officinalis]|uniref:Uncharacterized protein n=1 Tax=Asparagus officinalis TaxID=4686 RepID=A0A5P1FBV0_ASPOF|nr:uncharacterized protein A4U43_C03F1970 [Asparagus officinalis]